MTATESRPGTWIEIAPGHAVSLAGQVFTPAVAAAWLASYHYPRQRHEYDHVINHYATIMSNGDWRVSTLMLCEYTGAEPSDIDEPLPAGNYVMNGRHRLAGLVKAGVTLYFLIEHHLVDAEADVHELYATQDRGRSRSVTDVFKAMGLDLELSMSVGNLRMIGEAEGYIASSFDRWATGVADPHKRAAFVRDWRVEGRAWLDCLAGSRSALRPYITSSPVTAVALATLRGQPEKAKEFWTRVAHNDGLRVGTPEKTLIDWIYERRVREMPSHHYARYVASAWNNFFVGNLQGMLTVRDLDAPINIVGTPWERRRIQRRKREENGDGNGDPGE